MMSKSLKQFHKVFQAKKFQRKLQTDYRFLSSGSGQPFEFFKKGIYKTEYDGVPVANQDVCTFMMSRWEKWRNVEALECISTGRIMTYGQLLDSSLQFGAVLQNMNLRTEPDIERVASKRTATVPQRISIASPNVIEYPIVLFGALAAGFSLTTINPNYKVAEITRSIEDTKPQLLVIDPSMEDLVDQALKIVKMQIPVITIGVSKQGKPNLRDILSDQKTEKIIPKKVNASDVALILHSGGTTGLPKGVAIPHSAITNNITGHTDPRLFPFSPTVNPHQTVIGLMPFFHSYGLYVVMLTNLSLGSKVLVCKDFNKNTFGKMIKSHKIQYLHLVPTLLNFVVNSPEVTTDDLASVKGAIIAAAPVLPSTANALREKVAHDIAFQEGFGMTEILCSNLTPANSVRIGYCGKLIPNTEAKIIDIATNALLGPGEKGELLIKSTALMSHYLNNPKATAQTIDDEGWLHTGDVALSSEDGYFSIVDRIKELIKVKGYQVSPAEIEDVLMKHPAVAEAGVVGIPDDKMGERPRAYVTLKGNVTKEELLKLVEDNLASYKALTGGITFLEDLPKSQSGKILRKDLKELALENIKNLK